MPDAHDIDFLSRRLVSLRAITWDGVLPTPGDFIATGRGLNAYQVVEVRENRRPDPKSRALFRCWKLPVAAIPEDARVHPWYWSSRD